MMLCYEKLRGGLVVFFIKMTGLHDSSAKHGTVSVESLNILVQRLKKQFFTKKKKNINKVKYFNFTVPELALS